MAIELKIGFVLDEQDLEKICSCWNEEIANAPSGSGSEWEDREELTVNDIVSSPSLTDYIATRIRSYLENHWADMGNEMIWDADIFDKLENHR